MSEPRCPATIDVSIVASRPDGTWQCILGPDHEGEHVARVAWVTDAHVRWAGDGGDGPRT